MAASRLTLACSCAVADGVQRRSIYVALVVGTLLNLIDQGDAFFGPAVRHCQVVGDLGRSLQL
jgi:hypothetical protein